ncbi:MAG TPA: MFS transporter [Acidimicrobiales bacterium]|nr:MFS transporter [Acidimicrobiales bacterium]
MDADPDPASGPRPRVGDADRSALLADAAQAGTDQVAALGPTPRGLASLQPFRHRNFALLWSGGLISVVGSWMQTVAVGALVIAHTGKASWAVVIAAGGFLPIGLLSPIGGALADRLPRRPVLATGNLLAGVVALVIALLVSDGRDGPGLLTLLVTVQGCVSALIGPFQQAILPDLVPRTEFLAAASLNSAQFNLGRVIGPALAGILVAAFGYPVAFVANAVSFLAVVLALVFVRLAPPPPAPPEGRPGLLSALRSGVVAARAEPGCRAAIIVIAVVALLASPFIALVPAVAHRLSHDGARGVASATGWLTTAQGVGAVLGALLIAPLAERLGRGRLLVGALFGLTPVLVLYDFAPSLTWAVLLLFLVGLVYIGVLSGLSTVVQLRAPTEFRGRILSLYLVALGVSYPIGSLIQGPIADRLGLPWTTAGAAVVCLLVLGGLRLGRSGLFKALTSG